MRLQFGSARCESMDRERTRATNQTRSPGLVSASRARTDGAFAADVNVGSPGKRWFACGARASSWFDCKPGRTICSKRAFHSHRAGREPLLDIAVLPVRVMRLHDADTHCSQVFLCGGRQPSSINSRFPPSGNGSGRSEGRFRTTPAGSRTRATSTRVRSPGLPGVQFAADFSTSSQARRRDEP